MPARDDENPPGGELANREIAIKKEMISKYAIMNRLQLKEESRKFVTLLEAAKTPTWDENTTPFDLVRYFADDSTTDEQIKEVLEKYFVTTLQQLEEEVWEFIALLRKDASLDFNEAILDALNTRKAEEVLGGILIYDSTCIAAKSLARYAPQAVSVEPVRLSSRVPNYSLITGSSGSGKTMFALRRLPQLIQLGDMGRKDGLRIHVNAGTLIQDSSSATINLPALVVAFVENLICSRLSTPPDNPSLNLYLHVTIDEAEGEIYKRYFDHGSKIEDIANALKEMTRYNFKLGVHVSVVGAVLETATQDIVSSRDSVTFRMQPWTVKNFNALVLISERDEDEESVIEMVSRFPILQDLATNARCAYFLIESLPILTSYKPKKWVKLVDVAVSDVARCYIASKELASLTSEAQKLQVARATWKALDDAMRQPEVAAFPRFLDIQDESLRHVAQSLLDIPVEIRAGEHHILGRSKYSVSMTPAIAIILAELLNSNVSWDSEGVAFTAALGEWKKIVTETQELSLSNLYGIAYLRSPFPADTARWKFSNSVEYFNVPVVSSSTVLVNCRAAEYADLIAPYRLLQVKHTRNSANEQRVDLEAELNQLGLTASPEFRLQQAITSVLYLMWPNQHLRAADVVTTDEFERLPFTKEEQREHYPYQSLLSGSATMHKEIEFSMKGDEIVQTCTEYEIPLRGRPINVLEEFSSSHPVTAVFVTNSRNFVLTQEGKGDVTITRDHVDWHGVLKEPLPHHLVSTLRMHVDMRFMFY
jgi:hypothetical protein